VTTPDVRHERPSHQAFAPVEGEACEQRTVELRARLVALARVPGVVRLLVRWHDRRAKK